MAATFLSGVEDYVAVNQFQIRRVKRLISLIFPMVNLILVRQFRCEYAAVSPWDRCLDYMTAEKMNTENMSAFLAQISRAHPDKFIIMEIDGAHPTKAKISSCQRAYPFC